MKIKIISKSVEETIAIAKKIAGTISKPKIILLAGDLGAGKTHFVKGIAKGLGSSDQITSPTFTIMNEYEGKMPIYHFDMYRLSSAEEAESLGFSEYFDYSTLKGLSIVEWPENTPQLFPKEVMKISLNKTQNENEREIVIEEEVC